MTATAVFVSYSRTDRSRVKGLGLLLEALGHKVFVDHRTILPGRRWEAALQEGLDAAKVLLVYWTRHSARSEWVRRECDYFHFHYPDRPLVPILGDETPLSELLSARQSTDFAPIVNELLELQRQMLKRGAGKEEIREAILKRMAEAGIELDETRRRKLFPLFGGLGALGGRLSTLEKVESLGGTVSRAANTMVEAAAHLTLAQAGLVAAAACVGFLVCPLVPGMGGARRGGLLGGAVDGDLLTGHQQDQLASAGIGPVRVTLLWANVEDLDLHVTDPAGEVIYFGSRTSSSGGDLDVDDHGGCSDPDLPSGVENVVWTENAPTGAYRVEVNYFTRCVGSAETPYQVVVNVDGTASVFDGVARVPGETTLVTEFER